MRKLPENQGIVVVSMGRLQDIAKKYRVSIDNLTYHEGPDIQVIKYYVHLCLENGCRNYVHYQRFK